jgi:threonine aldolase
MKMIEKPTEKMRMAMFSAEVGDDPTVKKEFALFFPSGSMVHTNEGDEVIVEEKSHFGY